MGFYHKTLPSHIIKEKQLVPCSRMCLSWRAFSCCITPQIRGQCSFHLCQCFCPTYHMHELQTVSYISASSSDVLVEGCFIMYSFGSALAFRTWVHLLRPDVFAQGGCYHCTNSLQLQQWPVMMQSVLEASVRTAVRRNVWYLSFQFKCVVLGKSVVFTVRRMIACSMFASCMCTICA